MTGTYCVIGHEIAVTPALWLQPTRIGSGGVVLPADLITTASLAGATIELNALLGSGNATQCG